MGDRLNYISDAGFSLLDFLLALCIRSRYCLYKITITSEFS